MGTGILSAVICVPMDRYESRMKLVSDCIRSGVFILTAAVVELMKLSGCMR